MGKFKLLTFNSEEECKAQVLDFLRNNRSRNEISIRTGQTPEVIEMWANEWRNNGQLPLAKRRSMSLIHAARLASNGYYKSIRKRYASMIWNDKLNNRVFGFSSPVDAIAYFLKDGVPRSCAYCGAKPPAGKVWGLDRLDSFLGHIPGNLVPCCGNTEHGSQMSCQASKSKYPLKSWLAINMARTFGRPATVNELDKRVKQIQDLARELCLTHSTSDDIIAEEVG
jgi:hypothetical protein